MKRRPGIEPPVGDNPVLDILRIANEDYVQGRLTSVAKLLSIMYDTYPHYDRAYLKKLVNITIHSEWFGKSNHTRKTEVHLVERGVEVYLNMMGIRRAEQADRKTNWIIALTVLTILIMVAQILWQ